MCGRFTYRFTWEQLHRLMNLIDWPSEELHARYNVAPTQTAPIVRSDARGRHGVMLTWGLVPFWAGDATIGQKMINARADGVTSKPAFRDAFLKRRCLVPISGFYEWQKTGEARRKQPFVIERSDQQPFLLAGLWERWTKGESPLETFTIITTEANALLEPIHDRMPAIIETSDAEAWLSPSHTDADALHALLKPADPTGFRSRPISTLVNSPKNDESAILDQSGGTLFGQ